MKTSFVERLLSRRKMILAGGLLGLGFARNAQAFGNASKFFPAMVVSGPRGDGRKSGLIRLSYELTRRTSAETVLDVRTIDWASPLIFEHPFIYWGADGRVNALNSKEIENMRRYLAYGGFILADANDANIPDSAFDTSFRTELARVLPKVALEPIPQSHVVFKSFYLLEGAVGRVVKKPQLEMARIGGRVAVAYSANDLMGALCRDETGFLYDCVPGGERQREWATRLAINLVMYSLCLDYKDDAVHLPLIMNRRR